MSRSGYTNDYGDCLEIALWRGNVANAIRGKRGQAFLRELIEALDALPEKVLIKNELYQNPPAFIPPEYAMPRVCAIGSVGLRRGINMDMLDPHDPRQLADVFGIAYQLVAEIEYLNDERFYYDEKPDYRWRMMRDWAVRNLKEKPTP